MKRLFLILTAAACILATSCQVPTSVKKAGSLSITLPAPPAGRAGASVGSMVKVQLFQNGAIVSTPAPVPYVAGQTVSIENLQPGSGYTLFVSSGNSGASGYFETAYYGVAKSGTSGSFSITAGSDTPLSVTMTPSQVVVIEDAKGTNHFAGGWANGSTSTLVYTQGTNLYWNQGGTGGALSVTPTSYWPLSALLSSAVTLNSISLDAQSGNTVLLDTSSGIYNFSLTTPTTPAPAITPEPSSGVVAGVNFQVYPSPSSTPVPIAFYSGSNQTGGYQSGSSNWTAIPGPVSFSSNVDSSVGAQVNGATTPLAGSAGIVKNVFVASGGAVYMLPGTTVNTMNLEFSGNSLPAIATASGVTPITTLPTVAVNLISNIWDGANYGDNFVFAGTASGLFSTYFMDGNSIPAMTLVSGTSGFNITSLSTSPISSQFGNNASPYPMFFTAVYTPTPIPEILIYESPIIGTNTPGPISPLAVILSFAGLPAGTPHFTWYAWVDSSVNPSKVHLYLIATGTDSTVAVPVLTWNVLPS